MVLNFVTHSNHLMSLWLKPRTRSIKSESLEVRTRSESHANSLGDANEQTKLRTTTTNVGRNYPAD